MCALERFSNDVFPCLAVFNEFQYIVEPNEEQETGKYDTGGGIPEQHGVWIDLRSMITNKETSGTVTTTVDHNINFVTIMEKEQEVVNTTADGLATTLTTAHHYSGNIIDPKTANGGFRIRKLTPRECFRLMGVDDADIDKIQAAGISNAQQYKLAGNSIVTAVLAEIFRKMFIDTENENQQLYLF